MRDKPLQSDSEDSEDLDMLTGWLEMDPDRLLKKLKIPLNLRRETVLASYEPLTKKTKFTNPQD
jgi:hypothetical protein